MSRSIPQGTVLAPSKQDPMRLYGTHGYQTALVGVHVYLGKNRWLLPSGRIRQGQTFHRKILYEFSRGWWCVIS